MKILMVSGPVHYVYSLCRALGEAGETVRLLAPSVYDVVDGYPTPYAVRRPFQEGGYLPRLRALLEEAREFRPDVIHFQWTFAPRKDWFMARWLSRLGAPAVFTVHNVLPHEPAFAEQWALGRLYRRFRALCVHAESTREELMRLGIAGDRVAVIPHGNFNFIRERFGMPGQAEARAALGLPAGAPTALFFGGMRGYKGLGTLVEAFREVRRRIPAARLMIAGQGFGDEAERLAAALDGGLEHAPPLRDAVMFRPGFVPDADVPALFAAADVVVLPYVTGTYSGVVHLAYAFEKPVVTTRVGAVGAGVEEDGTGLAVPPGDAAALAEACAALLSDPAARARCAERVRAASREKYDWARIARHTVGWDTGLTR